ncbi:MAG: cobyrinate a,c-diamide synthase [Clostridia bacterium]|nr:cobyrinate a,c-diamide synthase [Clostridia bacterium]
MRQILIAAPKSGSGKTIFTCGLLNLLKRQGPTASYKCGPDFIDPMFHRTVIGVDSENLDPFFSDAEEVRGILTASDAEYAVLEGVMGIYDGISGQGKRGSCYEIARMTGAPILLVMDAKGMGYTLLSLIKGILTDDEDELIRGLVLNRISENYYAQLAPQIKTMLAEMAVMRGKAGSGRAEPVRLLGFIPNEKRIRLESRHLGLKMPGEIADLKRQVDLFSALLAEHCDVAGILDLMAEPPEFPTRAVRSEDGQISSQEPTSARILTKMRADEPENHEICPDPSEACRQKRAVGTPLRPLTLAVARDEAFCFYYAENLRAFTRRGVQIREFSPLRDEKLPEGTDGLLLGGGYPELYAAELSGNLKMREAIAGALAAGLPSLAECGGFMYLLEEMETETGVFPMLGVLPGRAANTGKLSRFGYITVQAERDGLLPAGAVIKGHEFHYFDTTNNGRDARAEKASGAASWPCLHLGDDHAWGYPHLWYDSQPELVERMIAAMRRHRGI